MIPQTEVPNDTTPTQTAPAGAKPASGYKSSELAVTVATALPLILGCIPSSYAPLVAALGGLYVASRTLLKVAHTLGYAKGIPDLPNVEIPPETLTKVSK